MNIAFYIVGVNEKIFSTAIRSDETKTFLCIEKLNCTLCFRLMHLNFLIVYFFLAPPHGLPIAETTETKKDTLYRDFSFLVSKNLKFYLSRSLLDRYDFKYGAVFDFFEREISSGVPSATTSPPSLPASGPKSMT